MSAATRHARAAGTEPIKSGKLYRGLMLTTGPKGGWVYREVCLPAHIAEAYAVDKPRPPHLKPQIEVAMEKWLGNPDLLRMDWGK
jgi:hypothetical protein